MENIWNFANLFLDSFFHPFDVIERTKKERKYMNGIDIFVKTVEDFWRKVNDYRENNSIISNHFNHKLILFMDKYNGYLAKLHEMSNYFANFKNKLAIAANIKDINKKLKLLYKEGTKDLSPELNELYRLLKREELGIVHIFEPQENPALAVEHKPQPAVSNAVVLSDVASLKESYLRLVFEIRNIYTAHGIQENQMEIFNRAFGIEEKYENYKRKEIRLSVLNEQN